MKNMLDLKNIPDQKNILTLKNIRVFWYLFLGSLFIVMVVLRIGQATGWL